MLTGRHYQNAYVTRDVDAAVARFRQDATPRTVMEITVPVKLWTPAGEGEGVQKLAFVWIEDLQVELIQPISGDVLALYRDALPADDSLKFHHICQLVDDWESFYASVDQERFPLVLRGGHAGDAGVRVLRHARMARPLCRILLDGAGALGADGRAVSVRDRYGPWAVIAGASEGTGAAIARQLAAEGIHCLLIARREGPLATLAEELRATGVKVRTAAIDLSEPDAAARIAAAADGLEVGLYVANAGGDPYGEPFLDRPLDDWIGQFNRGVLTTLSACHRFAGAMRERGRGGLLLIGSGACYGGAASMAVYSATKAFTLTFAESLWAELKPAGVDVLYMALGTTDTPEFRRFMAAKGLPMVAGLADPAMVAAAALAQLPHGPLVNWGQADEDAGRLPQSAAARRARVEAITAATARIFGERSVG